MKQGCLAVCLWLLVALSAGATFVRIDQQLTTPYLLVFDIGWARGDDATVPGENSFLGEQGNLLWHVGIKDQSPSLLRLLDVDVRWEDPATPRQPVTDSWSFFYNEERRFDRLQSDWRWDEQQQSGERTFDGDWWDAATFTLLDPYSARVTYTVPEPSVMAISALFAALYAIRRRIPLRL